MYSLSEEQTKKIIKDFKSSTETQNAYRITTNTGVLSSDSSIWLLEATLNYNFDTNPENTQTFNDTCTFSINNENPSVVNENDFISAYNYFNSFFNQNFNSDKKIKVIDLSAFYDNGTLKYVAYYTFFISNSNGYRTTSSCDPITIQGHFANALGIPGIQCASETNHGPQMCNARLNCTSMTCATGSLFYTNVTTVTQGSNDPANQYFYHMPYAGDCEAVYLTASKLNSNVTSAQNAGVVNKPTSPTGMVVSNYAFNCNLGIYPNSQIWIAYWQLKITYGVPNCSAPND